MELPSHFDPQPPVPTALAPLACLNCKTRKKGCDKRLPSCGHCAHRAVYCNYPKPLADNEANLPSGSEKPGIVAAEYAKHWPSDVQSALFQSMHPSVASLMMLAPSWPNATPFHVVNGERPRELTTVDKVLHHQVCMTIFIYGRYPKEISERYFCSVHRWLSIITRSRFQDRLVNFHTGCRADFSVLLLAMCLLTSERDSESNFPGGAQEALYLTTKMLFAHVQTHIASSVSLVQVGLLIATFEFACGMLDVAYVSIGTCVRMAFAAGMRDNNQGYGLNIGSFTAEEREKQNIWWGVVICERLIISETDFARTPLATQPPSADYHLPFDFDADNQNSKTDSDLTLSPLGVVTNFGREAQAACLYAEVMEKVQVKDYNNEKQSQLSEIDRTLQEFFKGIMRQSGTTWGLYCGAITFTICAMFTLHEHILDMTNDLSALQEVREISEAAIRTAVRMVVDVARSFNSNIPILNIEALPPRCSHLVRAARHLLVTCVEIPYEKRLRDYDEIRKMLGCLGRRWRCARIALEGLEKEVKVG